MRQLAGLPQSGHAEICVCHDFTQALATAAGSTPLGRYQPTHRCWTAARTTLPTPRCGACLGLSRPCWVGDRLRRMSHSSAPVAPTAGLSTPASVAVHTKVDASLAASERRFANDPERADLIARTRRFKASWIELAEALSTCQKNQRYTAWGYVSFEEYYRKELHLKTSTVNKLVGTYAFLRKTAPEVFDRDGVTQEYPSLQNIEFLRRAEDAAQGGSVAQDLLAEVRRAILDENLPHTQINRQFRESLFPSDVELEQKKQRREALRLARKLVEALAALEGSVPNQVLESVQAAIDRLLQLVPTEEQEEQPAA